MLTKIAIINLFFGLPIACGEWSGPFWVQVLMALSCFLPFGVVVLKERRKAYGKDSIAHRGAGQKKGA